MSGTVIVNDDVKAAIHDLIAIEGLDFRYVANLFHLEEIECRRLYATAKQQAIDSHQTRALYVREINEKAYQRIIHQANQAWEKSKQPKATKVFKEVTEQIKVGSESLGGTETKTTEEQKTEGQNGDPRFLSIQLDALDKVSKLHGAEAPKRVEVDTKTTLDVYLSIDALPLEERQKMSEVAKLIQSGVIVIEDDEKAEAKR